MAKILLITFGCSWTYGVGVGYEKSMSKKVFVSNAWKQEICDRLSWRGLLCGRFDLSNLNFSCGGSSNQKQFRLAVEFFGSDQYQTLIKNFDKIVVIWGVTSTARNELWSLDHDDYYNFFYSEDNAFSRFMIENSYNHHAEVSNLRDLMLYWNVFFAGQDIENFWFDTFNSHDYEYYFSNTKWVDQDHYENVRGPDWPSYENFCRRDFAHVRIDIIKEINEIFNISSLTHDNEIKVLTPIKNLLDHDKFPRDQMSWLMQQIGLEMSPNNQSYHHSNWSVDREGMIKLVKTGLLNPYSYHPTKKGHRILADYFSEKLQAIFTVNG